jgi:hypothetical protein
MAVKLKKLKVKAKKPKPSGPPPPFAPTPYNKAVSRLMKQREILEKRQALARVLRDESAAVRAQAAKDALQGMRGQGFTPGLAFP